MAISFDLLWLRVPPIRYVSPPACENVSSGSGSSGPIIVVEHPARFRVTGLRVVDCVLHWDALPADCSGSCSPVICFNVYRADTETGEYEVIAECVHGTEFPLFNSGCYRVSALTTEGESDLSDSVCVEAPTPENLIWMLAPDSDQFFSLSGGAGNFQLLAIAGQSKSAQVEASVCNPDSLSSSLTITIPYSVFINLSNNQAQLDVWSSSVPLGTFQVVSVGPASTSGTIIATIPLPPGPTVLFIRVSASSALPDGIVDISGSISIT